MRPDELDQLVRLIDSYTVRQSAIQTQAEVQAVAAYAEVDFYDTAQVRAAAQTAAGVSAYATNATAGLASQFYLVAAGLMGGPAPSASVASVDVGAVRGPGVDPVDVYGRIAKRYQFDITRGFDPSNAAADAGRLLLQTIGADLMLAQRSAMSKMLNSTPGVTRYRRVVRPELSTTGVCGLCLAAADHVYRKADLLPIHHRCKCIVLPIVDAEAKVPEYVNDVTLSELYDAADSTSGRELKKIRYRVEEHGELGPVLVQQGHRFTGPTDLAA